MHWLQRIDRRIANGLALLIRGYQLTLTPGSAAPADSHQPAHNMGLTR